MADLEGAQKKIDKVLLNWFIDDPPFIYCMYVKS